MKKTLSIVIAFILVLLFLLPVPRPSSPLSIPAPSLNILNLFTVGKKSGLFCFIEEFENFKD